MIDTAYIFEKKGFLNESFAINNEQPPRNMLTPEKTNAYLKEPPDAETMAPAMGVPASPAIAEHIPEQPCILPNLRRSLQREAEQAEPRETKAPLVMPNKTQKT